MAHVLHFKSTWSRVWSSLSYAWESDIHTNTQYAEIFTRRISDNAAISEPTGVIYPDRLWKESKVLNIDKWLTEQHIRLHSEGSGSKKNLLRSWSYFFISKKYEKERVTQRQSYRFLLQFKKCFIWEQISSTHRPWRAAFRWRYHVWSQSLRWVQAFAHFQLNQMHG